MKTQTEVLIVGAGPTGLALSIALHQAGVDHILIDRLSEGQNTSRAGVIHAQTLDSLAALGVSDELVARGLKVNNFTVRDRDKALLRLRFDALPSGHPYLLMLPQNITEQVLASRITTLGGVIHRRVTATCAEQDSAGARVTVNGPDGEQVISARYVVGADGMNSVVRQATGIGFDGGTYEDSFVLADVRLNWPLGQHEVSLFFSPAGLVVVAPLPGGSYRVVATMDNAPEHLSKSDVQAVMDSRGPQASNATVLDVLWSSRFRLHHRLANSYRCGRLILMGDAAHVHSPAGGQGMNTGLVDAVVLGETLAGVVGRNRPETMLDVYESLRRPAAARVLGLAGRLTDMATTLRRAPFIAPSRC
ncbi:MULTISPECIES: FAD-dependent monooxygenase [Bradyrhizobium]|uniref:FAD-dependent monooxygenase n=1 Tax=Bradyrhizobium TaxID=374 RepID=UPI0006889CE9|nr:MULTISPECIES: FAD-dependent monooxygenase [Bradyrhizobium]MCS3447268.1 2-polyprenyl-6-methoxyphenol hydroxylase-like FAD-dependent oxidoreductase [Bradyrhizobium elkanii]MCS3561595.1 2-polyprenyl-6-methoxyphenol hydroxylase-like FAD-dependent oxidoreductase [Bradyrhizobium elkanii]MCW2148564.1 2-polyprenyl-6-methoxyphenol hydroxylase-like FAD-dependent oxidoreductase [Bradyrhizobium elkanii]MCW2352349.1 2-polyprenyl-6-methoxyphenol hydroxylase-like FAD-dependent oxidoreductase [Bradyrhizobiu